MFFIVCKGFLLDTKNKVVIIIGYHFKLVLYIWSELTEFLYYKYQIYVIYI